MGAPSGCFANSGAIRAASSQSSLPFILPILVVLFTGAAEFGRILLLSQKLQNGAFILADLVGRDQSISVTTLNDVFLAVDMIMEPFEFEDHGVAIVTSVSGTATLGPIVNWQMSGAGDLSATSVVNGLDGAAILPESLSLDTGETLLVTEVYYEFQPLFGLLLEPYTIHRIAYHRPRLGILDELEGLDALDGLTGGLETVDPL